MQPEVNLVKLGTRIKEKRKSLNLTQEEMASKLNLTKNHLSDVERGVCGPSLEVLIGISYLSDTPVDYFLLDSPHISSRYLIEYELAPRLAKLSTASLQYIINMIDQTADLEMSLYESKIPHFRYLDSPPEK